MEVVGDLVASFQAGDKEAIRHGLDQLDEGTVQVLLNLFRNRTLYASDSGSFSGSTSSNFKASDLLGVLLCSHRTLFAVMGLCIELIKRQELVGRQLMYYTSDIRQALTVEVHQLQQRSNRGNGWVIQKKVKKKKKRRWQQQQEEDNDLLPNTEEGESAVGESGEVRHRKLEEVWSLLSQCTSVLTYWGASGTVDSSRLNDVLLLLDLLVPLLILAEDLESRAPVAAVSLSLNEEIATQEGGDSTNNNLSSGVPPPPRRASRDVMDKILAWSWPITLTLPLLSLCADLPSHYVGPQDWECIRGKVRANTPNLLGSDFPGLLRQLLVLAQKRRERCWLGLLRELYHALPVDSAGTVELVLEQCIKQGRSVVGPVLAFYRSLLDRDPQGDEIRPKLAWQDLSLVLLLLRSLSVGPSTGWCAKGSTDSVTSKQTTRLLLAIISRLISMDDPECLGDDSLVPPTRDVASSSSETDRIQQVMVKRRTSRGILLPSSKSAASPTDQCSQVKMKYLMWQVLTHNGASRQLGRLAFLRGQQLLSFARACCDGAERLCQELKNRGSKTGGTEATVDQDSSGRCIRVDELRRLCVVMISMVYGEAPEAQGLVLSFLLTAILEKSQAEASSRRSQLIYIQTLEVITSEWSSTLRQHSSIFQQLLLQLPTLAVAISRPVLEALAPLASVCPTFLDSLMGVARKCLVQSDVNGRLFGVMALTALLAQTHSGLLSVTDRSEEVASMFESILSLPLPLHLKSRVYHSITLSPTLDGPEPSAALPCLRAFMKKRLERFLAPRPLNSINFISPWQFSALSLFEEYRVQGIQRVTPRDDLAEQLRCMLALWQGPGFQEWLANAILGFHHKGQSSGPAVDVAGAFLDFISGGCVMSKPLEEAEDDLLPGEGAASKGGPLPQCDPSNLTIPEMLHTLVPVVDALLDTLLDCKNQGTETGVHGDKTDDYYSRVFMASLELFHVHGCLVDIAQSLDIPLRSQPTELQGREREFPSLKTRSSLNFIQLYMLTCRGGLSCTIEDGRSALCPTCTEVWDRHVLWGLQHAVMSLNWSLQDESERERWWDAFEAIMARNLSSKALLVLLMDLYEVCRDSASRAQLLRGVHHSEAQDNGEPTKRSACVCQGSLPDCTPSCSSGKGRATSSSMLPLSTSFLMRADQPLRDRLDDLEGQHPPPVLQELQSRILDLIGAVALRCPTDSLDEDQLFAFLDPKAVNKVSGEVASGMGSMKGHAAASSVQDRGEASPSGGGNLMDVVAQEEAMLGQIRYMGVPAFVNMLLQEMDQGLEAGLPQFLVYSFLELFDLLLSRLQAPVASHQMARYNQWRLEVSQGFLQLLVRHHVKQCGIFKRILRLGMFVAPYSSSLALCRGLMSAGAKYFMGWVRSQLPCGETITMEDLEPSEDEEEEEDENASGGEATTNSRHEQPDPDEEDVTCPAVESWCQLEDLPAKLTFPSLACWQASVTLCLTRWETWLTHGCQEEEEGGQVTQLLLEAYGDMMSQVVDCFLVPVASHRSNKLAAYLLPSPVKTKVLSIIHRLHGCCRIAANRVVSGLKAQLKARGLEKAGEKKSPCSARPLKRLRRMEDWSDDDDEEEEERVANWGEEDVAFLVAYVRASPRLAMGAKQWVAQERTKRKDTTGFLKRLPSALFAIERCDMALHRLMMEATRCSQALGVIWYKKKPWGTASWVELMTHLLSADRDQLLSTDSRRIASRLKEEEDEEAQRRKEEEDELFELLPQAGRRRGSKRRRLRSRNTIVDQWLEDEPGDDAYADLEDFIAEDEYVTNASSSYLWS